MRPRAVLRTKGTVFPNTDRSTTANNIFFLRDCFKSNFCVEFFIKEIQLKSGVRARIHEKSKLSFLLTLVIGIYNCLSKKFTFYIVYNTFTLLQKA